MNAALLQKLEWLYTNFKAKSRWFLLSILCLIISIFFLYSAPASASSPSQEVLDVLERGESVRVMVRLQRAGDSENKRGSYEQNLHLFKELTQKQQMTVVSQIPRMGIVVVAVNSPTQLQVLEACEFCSKWQIDKSVEPQSLAVNEYLGADLLHFFGLQGQGNSIAVLDTGIDFNHPVFNGRVVEQACFSSNYDGAQSLCPNGETQMFGAGSAIECDSSVAFNCGHGTHVAGIAAGGNSEFIGVAPASAIIAVQVFHLDIKSGKLTAAWSNILRALDWLIYDSTTNNLSAINISVGGERHNQPCDDSILADAISQLRSQGVATVVATGNEGWQDSVNFPACISDVLSVGSANIYSHKISSFTNLSSVVDILAPGEYIASSLPDNQFGSLNGTSMAAPHLSGAIATLKNAYPTASIDELEHSLKASPKTLTSSNGAVLPELDLWASFHQLGVHTKYKYELEEFVAGNSVYESEHHGYSGEGYLNTENSVGAKVELEVFVAQAGKYKIKLNFANGGKTARPMHLIVNNSNTNKLLEFAPTTSWHHWSSATVVVSLAAGNNNLTLAADTNEGGPNLDYLLISPYLQANLAPVVVSPMANLNVFDISQMVTVPLQNVFKDNDEDILQYEVTQSDAKVADVTIAGGASNPYVHITPKAGGYTTVRVSANDGLDQVNTEFVLTVELEQESEVQQENIEGTLQLDVPNKVMPAIKVASLTPVRAKAADGSSKAAGSRYGNIIDNNLSTYWSPKTNSQQRVSIKWEAKLLINAVKIAEALNEVGRVEQWRLINESTDQVIAEGFGLPKLIEFDTVSTKKLSLMIDTASGTPAIAEFKAYY